MTQQIVEIVSQEIVGQNINWLGNHCLLKAQTKDYLDYLRNAQIRFLLDLVVERLIELQGDISSLENQLDQLLEQIRGKPAIEDSQQLAQKLEHDRQVKLSADHLRRVLKKKGVIWKRTRQSYRRKQDLGEKADKLAALDMLQWSAAVGEIDLFYLDESGFCLWMPTEYSYFFKGEQKRLEQTKRKGRRISILGLLQPLVSFIYGLVVGSFNGERYITMMDEQAGQAKQKFDETGRIRVIVQDNSPIHTSKQVKAKWGDWESLGLYLFFLPKYCSEMNQIETEWHQLKTHELRGQMFEDELELAYAVIDGVDARAESRGYQAERFRFPSKLVPS